MRPGFKDSKSSPFLYPVLTSITLLCSWRKMTKCGIACPDRRTKAPGPATVRLPQRVLINFLQTEDAGCTGRTELCGHATRAPVRFASGKAGWPLPSDPPVQAKSEKSQGAFGERASRFH